MLLEEKPIKVDIKITVTGPKVTRNSSSVFQKALDDGLGAGFTIVSDGKEIKVSSFVLMAHSDVFKTMIESEFSESKERTVTITDFDY